ncbi:MAG: pantothenate synthetase [Actinomycetota bacterium]
MLVINDAVAMRRFARTQRSGGRSVAFVPTMGALHDGHLELVREARRLADDVVLSIFVNPLQFNVRSDFDKYPRDMAADAALAAAAGVTVLYAPSADGMYPAGFDTTVHVERTAAPLEGAGRPGHFDGVATVVCKLLNAVEPDFALFGRKDYQQLAVVTRMARDLDMGVEIIGVDTVREPDGLAMSSRNVRLTAEQRKQAPAIHDALSRARESLNRGLTPGEVRRAFTEQLDAVPGARVEYVSVADAGTLEELESLDGPAVISCAVWFGDVRLIDNVPAP